MLQWLIWAIGAQRYIRNRTTSYIPVRLIGSRTSNEKQTNLEKQGLPSGHGIGLVGGFLAACLIGLGGHVEFQDTAGQEVGMG